MTKLLVHIEESSEQASPGFKFGGMPSAPNGDLNWPVCKCCQGNMQFLGQLSAPEHQALFLLFMCANDPGVCGEWDPNDGGNAVVTVSNEKLMLVQPPSTGDTIRPTRYGGLVVDEAGDDYEASRGSWTSKMGRGPREVLGQIGGTPSWIQGEETPQCECCGKPMVFFAQLEQGPDWKTEMNFGGGGCAYVFKCACDGVKAKFLWQC